jgi:diguanylate cyclase (GGDEF)-like protein/PAS domain S-box-containing protein
MDGQEQSSGRSQSLLVTLAGNRSLLLALFNGSREGLVLLGRECTIQAINQTMLTWLHQTEEEVLGKPLSALLFRNTKGPHSEVPERVAKEAFESRCAHGWTPFIRQAHNGSTQYFEIMGYPIVNHQEAVEYVLEAICDVTEKKTLIDRLQEVGLRDELTNLYNRKAFQQIFPQELKRAQRQKYPLTLLLLDIDFFKDLNEKEGTSTGDHHLQATANVLRSFTRQEVDSGFRFEADYFALILPDISLSHARTVARRIIKAYEHMGTDTTLSIGIREMHPGENAEDMLLSTQEELYRAKKAGGNTICG